MTSITKQRVKLNIKVLGVNLGADQGQAAKPISGAGGPATSGSGQTGEKQQVREQFKAPDMSIVSKLMSKVRFFPFLYFIILNIPKGQLISKGLFSGIVSTKKQTKVF